MKLIEQHKAFIITFLLTGIVVFGMFSVHLTKKNEFIAESLYEIEPKTEEELKEELAKIEDLNAPSTNKAFNEDQEFKELMKNFKMVSSNDFEKTTEAIEAPKANDIEEELTTNSSYTSNNSYALKASETESYNKLKEKLKKRTDNKDLTEEHAKGNSTLTYSLKDRTLLNYNTPRYLCERNGKIVVSIKVNEKGDVIDASVNGASNSDNQCLIDHAIDYAKSVRFNTSDRRNQIGTITFLFKGKK
ncbi:hypothetical protein [Winogradskyella immobilis]|uniref:TonB family protein n=1 Tax=Winogradskyella immobilis TaxID=2816852 RepID=A0ABS8EL02_9FLAO|nr:hypothetical protein [Winogradskyella immobilis]MCC1483765.1 hypothetical protein [Winogradskyella immobilis]MCG0015859.1 hypothetical protein [Winogradskyella immobilis]